MCKLYKHIYCKLFFSRFLMLFTSYRTSLRVKRLDTKSRSTTEPLYTLLNKE